MKPVLLIAVLMYSSLGLAQKAKADLELALKSYKKYLSTLPLLIVYFFFFFLLFSL